MTGGCNNGFIVGFLRICGSELLRRTYRYSQIPRLSNQNIRLHNVQQLLSIIFPLVHILTMHFHLHLPGKSILKRIWASKMSEQNSPMASKYLQHSDRSLILLLKSRVSEPSSTFPSPLYSFYWFCCHRNHQPPCFSPVSSMFISIVMKGTSGLMVCRRCAGLRILYLRVYVGIVDIIFVGFVGGLLIKRGLRWELLRKGVRGKGVRGLTCEWVYRVV
jgi:hypothetical protein